MYLTIWRDKKDNGHKETAGSPPFYNRLFRKRQIRCCRKVRFGSAPFSNGNYALPLSLYFQAADRVLGKNMPQTEHVTSALSAYEVLQHLSGVREKPFFLVQIEEWVYSPK